MWRRHGAKREDEEWKGKGEEEEEWIEEQGTKCKNNEFMKEQCRERDAKQKTRCVYNVSGFPYDL